MCKLEKFLKNYSQRLISKNRKFTSKRLHGFAYGYTVCKFNKSTLFKNFKGDNDSRQYFLFNVKQGGFKARLNISVNISLRQINFNNNFNNFEIVINNLILLYLLYHDILCK